MTIKHILTAWIGTLVIGSLFIYPMWSLIFEIIPGVDRYGSLNDYWQMTVSYGFVATVLSIPNLAVILILRPWLRNRLRFQHQIDVMLLLSLAGIWIGAMSDGKLEAAIAYSVSALLSILIIRFEPLKRRSSLVL